MISRHRSDNEDAIINQLIMETPRKNVTKDGIRLLGSRPIDPKQRIIIFKHKDETEVSKILQKFKGDDVFLGCLVCISTLCIKRKKKLTTLQIHLSRKTLFQCQLSSTKCIR